MKKKNLTRKNRVAPVKRERDPIPWRYCLLTLVCGVLLSLGFFWAAMQHFSAMDLSMKNAKLREERQNLEDKARELYLTKQNLMSFDQLKKAAKKYGLQSLSSENIQVLGSVKTETKENPAVLKTALVSAPKSKSADNMKKETPAVKPESGKDLKDKKKESVPISRTQIARK